MAHSETDKWRSREPSAASGHVLLVSERADLGGPLGRALEGLRATLPRAARAIAPADISDDDLTASAAVVVDCRRPDPVAWLDLFQRAPDGAFILIVSDNERSAGLKAIMDGAQDFIDESELDERRLRRSIECAVERVRVERTMRRKIGGPGLDTLHRQPALDVAASVYGLGSLEKSLPGDHRFLIAEYAAQLQRMLDSYGFEAVSEEKKDKLVALVEKIGAFRATPRDLVTIHSLALEKILASSSEERRSAVSGEARFVLLEAMGYLAYYYRRYSVQLPY